MSGVDYYRRSLAHSPIEIAMLLSNRPVVITVCPTESQAKELFAAAARALTSERPSELAGTRPFTSGLVSR